MVAIGEERLNRTRYSPGFEASLLYCLRAAGLTLADVDLVAVSGLGRTPPTRTETGLAHLGIDRERILPVDHHLSHAYTAYCLSSCETATVLVVDGGGNNNDTETYYAATPDGIERLGGNPPTRPRAAGIGATYEAFTNHFGWHEQEAGKTMALASYGDPGLYLAPLFDVVDTQVHGRLTRTHAPGVADLARRTGFDFGPYGSLGQGDLAANAAAYVQDQTERAYAYSPRTRSPRPACPTCASPVGSPSTASQPTRSAACLGSEGISPRPPHPTAARPSAARSTPGTASPATSPKRPLNSDYFGRDYSSEEIEQALHRDPRSGLVERRRTPFTWRRESDIARTAAQMIAEGKIIGWFQGGSELGPRALGARSILADPRTCNSSDALNERIKHREPFRPFAPAVLADHASTWFDLDVPSPFMLLAPPVRPDHADKIAGVVHIDDTARVQTVDPAVAPAYGSLIEHFYQLTGVPVVLNTSSNDREPIVETPAHALTTFQACDLDAACIGECLVERS